MKEGTQKSAWRLPAQSDCSQEMEAWPSLPSEGGRGDDQRPCTALEICPSAWSTLLPPTAAGTKFREGSRGEKRGEGGGG